MTQFRQAGVERRVRRCLGWMPAVLVSAVFLAPVAKANEVDGAWSTRIDECANIFVKRDNQTYLAERADFYGSGFVVTGKTIRGKIATCKILSVKKTGTKVKLQAACTTDIMITNSNFDLDFVEPNKVIRTFPGIPEMNTPYYRCPAI